MLKGGIIGCGFFAGDHLNSWRMVDDAEIVALCDSSPERSSATSETFGIAARHTDEADMLAAQDLDFVDIITTVPTPRQKTGF